jgi:arginyl-tRNA synthetase
MVRNQIIELLKTAVEDGSAVDVSVPELENLGHYSTNVAMRLSKIRGKKPMDLAEEIAAKMRSAAPSGFFEKIETASPGFVNFWLSKETIQKEFATIIADETFGANESMKEKLVMAEFTDVNPFKQVHVGHLMSNAIGESLSRLYEAAGAKIFRVNYQSDVGLHVAMAIWAIMNVLQNEMPAEDVSLFDRMAYLGRAYATGSRAHRGENPAHPDAKEEIEAINGKVYNRSDEKINVLYDLGRAWSLAYFETLYVRLGTKFVHYFFESEVGSIGLEIIAAHPDIFEKSEGAIIFRGERYGLHTRVFVNSKGIPVYEGKELGLNKMKFDMYHPDLSLIITGNEITDYFKVLIKAMELTMPDVARGTQHVPHGMLRLPSGKMSSRTGDVITAESLLDDVKTKLSEHASEKSNLGLVERDVVTEMIAVGAIKYSILKQAPGQDIVFDFEKSLSVHGDSGPYLQYAYARLRSILRKAGKYPISPPQKGEARPTGGDIQYPLLNSDVELALIRKLFDFPEIVASAGKRLAPNVLATYLHQLATIANQFYESTFILKDENESRRDARLVLVEVTARILKSGLSLLGIQAPEKI